MKLDDNDVVCWECNFVDTGDELEVCPYCQGDIWAYWGDIKEYFKGTMQ